MDQILNTLPKGLVAALAIGGFVFFLLWNDPPKTVCDAQMNVFKESQYGFLLRDPEDKTIAGSSSDPMPLYNQLKKQCKATNSPGGCLELFRRLQKMVRDMESVPAECTSELSEFKPVAKALSEGIGLMARIAWGDKPPATYYQKFHWLDSVNLALFCDLQMWSQMLYGADSYQKFTEPFFSQLPGIENLSRKDAWEKMIFSVNCQQYP